MDPNISNIRQINGHYVIISNGKRFEIPIKKKSNVSMTFDVKTGVITETPKDISKEE